MFSWQNARTHHSALLGAAVVVVLAGISPPMGSVTARQQVASVNWYSTAQTALDVIPDGWTPDSPTVIFLPAAGGDIDGYRCYADTWRTEGIRTVIPLMAGGVTWEQRRSRWRQLNIVYEALRREPAGNWRRPAVRPEKLVIAGHSFGAYVALLAAGADSRIRTEQAGNCLDGLCSPLAAAGYLIISGQPAQNAKSDPPFWFGPTAFNRLQGNRLVVYGTKDFVATDACMTEGVATVPVCRGDAHKTEDARSQLQVVPAFRHSDFSCGSGATTESLTNLQRELGAWVQRATKQ